MTLPPVVTLRWTQPGTVALVLCVACGSSAKGSDQSATSSGSASGGTSPTTASGNHSSSSTQTSSESSSGGASTAATSGGTIAATATTANDPTANTASGGSSASGTTGTGGTTPDCAIDGDDITTLVFVNNCEAELTFEGSDIDSGTLAPGAFECRDVGDAESELPAKRYWGYVGANPGGEHHTLAEFTFNTDFQDFDWYNISHVDAHNLPMLLRPRQRSDCDTLVCAMDFLADCPEVGRFENADGDVVACVSPERDNGESPVALYFETCDDAYAWSGDDQAGEDPSPVRACAGEDWDIVFCPDEGT